MDSPSEKQKETTAKAIVVLYDGVNPYTAFRLDGWPLCPGCGKDELWGIPSTEQNSDGKQLWVIQSCYLCGWKPKKPGTSN
jgi:hypothetical protein